MSALELNRNSSYLMPDKKTLWMLLFQMSETGSAKVVSQPCSDPDTLPGDSDRLSTSQECKYGKTVSVNKQIEIHCEYRSNCGKRKGGTSHQSDAFVSDPEHQEVRTVEFTKGPADSLGISIAGGVGSPLGDIPIFIAMMNPVGLAAQTQNLKVWDLFLATSLSNLWLSSEIMHISNSCVGFNANLIYLLPLAQCMYSQQLPEAASS